MRTSDQLWQWPHRRKNILTGEWVLVSPQRAKRPWQGERAPQVTHPARAHEPDCYLCPGNRRAHGAVNPSYEGTFVFTNDFPAMVQETPSVNAATGDLLLARTEPGICRVVNFTPRHDLTIARMTRREIEAIISVWQEEFRDLGSRPGINYVQIFENKGAMMGNSNPHPHGQIWAQRSIPTEPRKELRQFRQYRRKHGRNLLDDYLRLERRKKARVVHENSSFSVIVPYWAVWPFETLVIARQAIGTVLELTAAAKSDFADAIRVTTVKYDNLFSTSFPYSAGLHQAPTDGKEHPEWRLHMHFYPPLLRSASIKKFMVGYEMLAEPQRDITPESSAGILKALPARHIAYERPTKDRPASSLGVATQRKDT